MKYILITLARKKNVVKSISYDKEILLVFTQQICSVRFTKIFGDVDRHIFKIATFILWRFRNFSVFCLVLAKCRLEYVFGENVPM